jgi:hypothetical protein
MNGGRGDRGRPMTRGGYNNPRYHNKRPHSLESIQGNRPHVNKGFNISHLVSQELSERPAQSRGEKRPEDKKRKLELHTSTNLTLAEVRDQIQPIAEVANACGMLLVHPLNSRTVENLANHWKTVGSGLTLIKSANLFNTGMSILGYFRVFGNPNTDSERFLGAIATELDADVSGPLHGILEEEYLNLPDEKILKNLEEIERNHMVRLTYARIVIESLEALIPVTEQVVRVGLPSIGLNTADCSEIKNLQVLLIN